GDGGLRGRPLRALHALREPRGVPVHLHGDHGHHGGRGREGDAGRARGRAGVLHGGAVAAERRNAVAVADAALRRAPARRALLHARRHRADLSGGPAHAATPLENFVTLEARDVTVRFGGVAALAGVSFTVAAGTV